MNDEAGPPEDPGPTKTYRNSSPPPERIDPYRLLEKLGEGGMGEVYLAEQEAPVHRRVALKIIKVGMDTKQVIARFEAERQALALMNHPNIARVYEAGASEQGRPYFAMEYIRGEPITVYCDRNRLTTRDRLGLFRQVCDGVQHAHQKAIIHRDIKPSNVLVMIQDDKPVPKIIDFGVAKAIEHRLTEQTVYTQMGVLVGTPEYMSPEQAEMTGLDVDTRTDVYSLGVLLYELLVGALPFDPLKLRLAGFDEMRRKIREEEPPKPSARLSTLGDASLESAKRRRMDLPALRRQLRGDLDWITMKALEKDRTRRYGSPAELAADVERHLKHEPVLASPPSAVYRTRKFARRHRTGVVFAATLAALLIGFGIGMSVLYVRAVQAEEESAKEAATAEQVSGFLADMLGGVEPQALGSLLVRDLRERIETARRQRGATDEEIEAVLESFSDAMLGVNATDAGLRLLDEQVLARAGQTIDQQLSEEPRIAARLEHTIGSTYVKLGLYAQAEPHTIRAVEIRKRVLGDDHPDTLASMNKLANLYLIRGRYDEAEALFLQTLETGKRVLGDDHPDTLASMNNLALLYVSQGRYDEAEPFYLQSLKIQKRLLGDDHPDTLTFMNNLAGLYLNQGRYDEAETLFLQTFEARKRVLGDDHPDTPRSMGNLANLYVRQGRYDEAEALYLETFETLRRVVGDDHPDTTNSLYNLACIEALRGDRTKAMDWLRQCVEKGYAGADWMLMDSDLKSLHGPEFDALVERARQNAEAQRAK